MKASDELSGDSSTKNQALVALRHFFDTLVTRQAAPLNPFQSVRGRKHDTTDGKTPGLSIPQARDLLGSIDTSHVVDLRDRALWGTLAYTGARIGAVARLQRGDLNLLSPGLCQIAAKLDVFSQPEFRMRPEANKPQPVAAVLLVDQHQVRLHVAITEVFPFAAQCMVMAPRFQGLVISQGDQDGNQSRFQ